MRPEDKSELLLRIELPSSLPGEIRYEDGQGESWRAGRQALDAGLSTKAVWEHLLRDWNARDSHLDRIGAQLGDWLLDRQALETLKSCQAGWRDSAAAARGRIELWSSDALAEYPWEASSAPGLGCLSIQTSFTFVRRREAPRELKAHTRRTLSVDLIGVQHASSGVYAELSAPQEVAALGALLRASEWGHRFELRLDPVGDWDPLSSRFRTNGPGEVVHLAGHGYGSGAGLVFRGPNGQPLEVPAHAVCTVLTDNEAHRLVRLVFLNACSTAERDRPKLQPFGPLAERLVSLGAPAVVALSVGVDEAAARPFALAFYRYLARGAAVDVALQAARQTLLSALHGPEWAFASLTLACDPAEVFVLSNGEGGGIELRPDILLDLGNEKQLSRLNKLFSANAPSVVALHGAARRGHRHLIEQIKRLASTKGRIFDPVPELHWFEPADQKLSRHLLIGVLARALATSDAGEEEAVIKRVGGVLGARSLTATTFVLSFLEPVQLTDNGEADALLLLVQQVWAEVLDHALIERRRRGREGLPIHLLVPLAYPDPERAGSPEARERAAARLRRVEAVVERLGESPSGAHGLVIKPLPRLEPLTRDELIEFLVEARLHSRQQAEIWIDQRAEGEDNETILERLTLLLRRKTAP